MIQSHTLKLKNDIKELNRLHNQLEKLAADWNIPGKPISHIDLALEELVTNIINYGYDKGNHIIIISFSFQNDVLSIQIQDYGKAFNPLNAPKPNIDDPAEKRDIGGLGIYLMKTLMDSIKYERINNSNILKMTKKIIP
ncbi:MAG: ATP-binding protein [Candidatus Latescibacteria bacterium]|nr:ATP-binding protein [Candidatus Latescibacterota bacterium]